MVHWNIAIIWNIGILEYWEHGILVTWYSFEWSFYTLAFWIVKFLDCYEPTWANLSQLEPTCGPKWPNGAAHAHAYCIIRAGNGNCWASVSATINLYFKHVTCSQDTFKMASSTQTRKIHAPIGLWILMVIIVRTAGSHGSLLVLLAPARNLVISFCCHQCLQTVILAGAGA